MSASRKRPARGPKGRPRPRRRPGRRLLAIGVPLVAIIVIAGIAIGVHLSTSSGPGTPDTSDISFVSNAHAEFAGIPSSGGTVGYPTAPVTVEEFGDLRCPICREFDSSVIPEVLQKLVRTKKAKLVYRHWPILGPNSVYANRAAYAAEKQNRLWEYALVTYYNQGDENDSWFTEAFARAVAASIGLDMSTFDKDFDNTIASTAQVAAVNKFAIEHSFKGTPTVLVIGPRSTDSLADITPEYSDIAKAVAKVTPR